MFVTSRRSLVDLRELTVFLESIRSFAPDLIFGPGDGKPLFHYTDLAGLLGIIENDDLWLTHSLYSNDAEELTHGYKIAAAAVQEASSDVGKSDHERTQYMARVGELIKGPSPEGVYICCFCQADNLLSQWRGYGANGAGVSIRLDPNAFAYVAGPESPVGGLMRLWRVFYDPAQQQRIVRSALDFAFMSQPAAPVETRARRAAEAIEFFIPTFKNEDFEEENEWRLIFTPPTECPIKPRLRVARGMLVPYFSLKDLTENQFRLPVTGVCIGPSAQRELNLESAKLLLAKAGYDPQKVVASKTPFRA